MSGITLRVTGFDEVFKKLDIKNLERDISDELTAFGYDVARDAKQLVPVDEGFLKNSINVVPDRLKVTIVVNADYAAFIEFGTRKFAAAYVATLPQKWQEFAAAYRGAGDGTFKEFVMKMVRWCKVKGIPENLAYPIARSILINGIKPQPYLYPAFEKNRVELMKNLKSLFNA